MTKIKKEVKKVRSFGGKTKDFDDADERNRESKHLRAYLRGEKFYIHGYMDKPSAPGVVTPSNPQRMPRQFKVLEVWTEVEE